MTRLLDTCVLCAFFERPLEYRPTTDVANSYTGPMYHTVSVIGYSSSLGFRIEDSHSARGHHPSLPNDRTAVGYIPEEIFLRLQYRSSKYPLGMVTLFEK